MFRPRAKAPAPARPVARPVGGLGGLRARLAGVAGLRGRVRAAAWGSAGALPCRIRRTAVAGGSPPRAGLFHSPCGGRDGGAVSHFFGQSREGVVFFSLPWKKKISTPGLRETPPLTTLRKCNTVPTTHRRRPLAGGRCAIMKKTRGGECHGDDRQTV